MEFQMKNRRIFRIVSLWLGLFMAMVLSADGFAYTAWESNSTYTPTPDKAKIRIRFKVRSIPVIRITQMNCIYRETEDRPAVWTKDKYKQPHCASLRNQREKASDNQKMPAGTKLTKVPANSYFKIRMEISPQMNNRVGEAFGVQIIDAKTKKTMFLQGGWKPGDINLSKAIKLAPGRYYWRCPVNPTPWYGLIAE